MTDPARKVVDDAEKAESWLKRHWVRLHASVIIGGWGVFEWLATLAANKLHKWVLHVFWHDFIHRIYKLLRGL